MEDHLERNLGVLEIFAIGAGAMISSGLFVLPAVLYGMVGSGLVAAYVCAGVLMIPALLSKAELATAMPRSGGTYFFVGRSLGPFSGTFAGLASWFSLSMKSAFALVGMGVFFTLFVPDLSPVQTKLIALGFTAVFLLVNLLGVHSSGRLQVILLFSLLFILVLYLFAGWGRIDAGRLFPTDREWDFSSLAKATGMVFISYGGLTKVASIAGEARDPGRTLPLGMFLAFIVVTTLYITVVSVTVGLLSAEEMTSSYVPLSLGGQRAAGTVGLIALSAAAVMAYATTANAGLLASSRVPYAMSQDDLVPSPLGRVSKGRHVPYVAVIVTAIFMAVVVVALDIENLVKVASTMKLILFLLVNLSVILMRESHIVSYRPSFRSPLYPWLQIVGILASVGLITGMGTVPLTITGGFVVISLLWYLVFGRGKQQKDSALVRIVERLTARELRSSGLEDELKNILIERDNIVEDRFDRLVRDATIVDLEGELSVDGLFDTLADILSRDLGCPREQAIARLHEREAESTTAIYPGLAIPHIVIDGSARFEIVIARALQGVVFQKEAPVVKMVFALAGSRDEREFHLKALMAIAQLVQDTSFRDNWARAKDTSELRDLILTSERHRHESTT